MRILITNDDGILAPALPHLVEWAKKLGEVMVVAPKVEQSGKSHAIDFTRPIEIKRVDLFGDVVAYSMDSTPADCVRFAVLGLKEKFDLVLSGINRGFNLGRDIVYSGTIGAIFEAARLDIKGVALSTDPHSFTDGVNALDTVWNFFEKNKLLEQNMLYNVNIPLQYKAINVTRQGGIYFTDEFIYKGNDIYEQYGEMFKADTRDISFDVDSVKAGYLSITPLTAEKTNLELYEKLKGAH